MEPKENKDNKGLQLEVALSPIDLLIFQLYFYWYKRRALAVIGMFFGFLGLCYVVIAVVFGEPSLLLNSNIWFLLFLPITLFVMVTYAFFKKRTMKDEDIDLNTYWINKEYIKVESKLFKGTYNWSNILEISKFGKYYCIFTTKRNALVFPEKSFADSESLREFKDIWEYHSDTLKNSLAIRVGNILLSTVLILLIFLIIVGFVSFFSPR